jgi:hypothetical protein
VTARKAHTEESERKLLETQPRIEVVMPTVTLTFTLPDELEDLDQALNAHKKCEDYNRVLHELWTKLRNKLKYEELTEAETGVYEKVRGWLHEACEAWDVEIL